MILVDTSVWIDHFTVPDPAMQLLLDAGEVRTHPFVIGELAMGSQQKPSPIKLLIKLKQVLRATDPEVLEFIRRNKLHGVGIGYMDAHLLASARMTPEAKLWTRDKRLALAAARLSVNYEPRLN